MIKTFEGNHLNFSFEHPWVFVLLALLPCFWRCPAGTLRIYFPQAAKTGRAGLEWGKEPLIYAAVFSLAVVALASPVTYDRLAAHERHGRDLVLVIDTSGSMAESGFDAENPQKRKFDVVMAMVGRFLETRYDDNMGLVMFGSFAYPASPITYDLAALKQMMSLVEVGIAGQSTAIGEGIATALRVLRYGHAKKKAMVLLTDGYANAGSVSVKEAVSRARKMGVKIYTVGIGKPGDYDGKMLKRVAKETGAESFAADDAGALQKVFERIDKLEPSPLRSPVKINRQMLYVWPLVTAMALLVGYLWRRERA